MYCPASFAQPDSTSLHDLIAAYPLGLLVTHSDGVPDADHLPFDAYASEGVLRTHVARRNPLWRRDGQQVLVVFRGPSAYVTPDRVEKDETGGRVVPTWTYNVVHVHGRLRTIDEPAWLLAQVTRLTDRMEGTHPAPWAVSDAPPAYIEAMLNAIVGLEIVIERIEGKWKTEPPPRVRSTPGASPVNAGS
ncbi:transcriptional regulator [Massilia sp. MP_M2]|uniref:FMN-binding negative transcriptional regulator n=1 Tax=Massilia sp. MP_M2 TaxID=3071713 RepID=UPI00319E6059